jgi:hypothetical protein
MVVIDLISISAFHIITPSLEVMSDSLLCYIETVFFEFHYDEVYIGVIEGCHISEIHTMLSLDASSFFGEGAVSIQLIESR